MTSMLAKYVSKKILGESLANKFGTEDPYFEQVPATRLDGRPSSKTKKRRKALPAGISDHDGKVLTKVKRRAYRLDMSFFSCCGIRFGWSSVIALIPLAGDAMDAFMAMMVFRTCKQVEGGLPRDVQLKMLLNIIFDFAVGLVPFIGDIVDAAFHANTKNAVLLENYLREKGAANLESRGHRLPAVDPSDPEEYDRHMNDEYGPPPGYATATTRPGNVEQIGYGPDHSSQPSSAGDRRDRGWFGGFGRKSKHSDLEGGPAPHHHHEAPLPSVPPRHSSLQTPRSTR